MTEQEFFDAIDAIRGLVSNSLLIDNPLSPPDHNRGAGILRHGLSVSSFALLEQYLQQAVRDFMYAASAVRVSYSDMNESFRKFVSISAATGLLNRTNFKQSAQRLTFFENEVAILPKFSDNPAQFSWHGFSPRGSNVSKDDISMALKAFGIEKPWEKLTRVTSELGSHRANLQNDYENLARTRHTSAHDPTGNVATSDLETNITVSVLIALTVSLLLRALKDVYLCARSRRQLQDSTRDPTINVRFLDQISSGQWLERRNSTGRAIKKYPDFTYAVAGARTRRGNATIVIRNTSRIPLRLV
ncbi:MAG: hypothetical protein GY788_32970 [bacterium]|nr:hypothetical protein [bacterium]